MNKQDILKNYFGYKQFRPGQEAVMDAVLSGRDVLAVMPTGAGKSLCYQIPALLLKGLTVVISPLISLMKDQVNALQDAGVPAAFLNSSLSPDEYSATILRAVNGEYKILYIAPERLQRGLPQLTEISLVVIDEAHCISQWGHDFRPSYLEITGFIKQMAERPITAAFTATATGKVKEDIQKILKLEDPYLLATGFNRENLYFEVQKPKDKFRALLECLEDRREKSGIIYCSTRKAVEEVCHVLEARGLGATRYHAGLDNRERRQNQDDFIYDRKPVMVATNAFGMGIDKSNVSFVIHYNMPKNIESYYQEAGRAGRDGEPADCILLYSPQDVRINKYLITHQEENDAEKNGSRENILITHNLELLKEMTFYATSSDCLRSRLLGYFGEKSPRYCGNCSNCNRVFEETDVTTPALKIISCVYRLEERGRRYGKTMAINILQGSKNEKILGAGLDTLSTYGIMADEDPRRIRIILEHLIEENYLALEGDEYPVLSLRQKARDFIREKYSIRMMLPKESEGAEIKHGGFSQTPGGKRLSPPQSSLRPELPMPSAEPPASDTNEALFALLKEQRTRLAQEAHVPAYVVFSDASLRDMCRKKPLTTGQFLGVNGVGKMKLEKYGEVFLKVIREFLGQR